MIESVEEFKRLRESENPDEYLRAAHEEAPMSVWKTIIDQYPDLRFWVAQNKTVPIEILKILAKDGSSQVRGMVARKRKIDEEIKDLLVKDPDAGVRNDLAWNAKLEPEYLKILAKDSEALVRESALNKLSQQIGGHNSGGCAPCA